MRMTNLVEAAEEQARQSLTDFSHTLCRSSNARSRPGGDVLGLSPHDGPLVSILLLLYWNKTEDDEPVLGTAKEILEAIDTDAAARGMSVPFKYLDYAFSFQDPIDKYGLENQTKLQEASRRYHGMLQNGVPGGFKLFH
ncbi:hypothetical protein PG995_012003 [Apiospora arundinis]